MFDYIELKLSLVFIKFLSRVFAVRVIKISEKELEKFINSKAFSREFAKLKANR